MIFKIGEFVICKKDFWFVKKNNIYKIDNIETSQINGTCLYNGVGSVVPNIFYKEENYIIENEQISESILSQFFYTKKELRKIKLKKICQKYL